MWINKLYLRSMIQFHVDLDLHAKNIKFQVSLKLAARKQTNKQDCILCTLFASPASKRLFNLQANEVSSCSRISVFTLTGLRQFFFSLSIFLSRSLLSKHCDSHFIFLRLTKCSVEIFFKFFFTPSKSSLLK